MKTVVLSTVKQHQKFRESGFDAAQFKVYCDNERIYDYLRGENVAFEKLEEPLLKSSWEKINAWGIDRAAGWIGIGRRNGLYSKYDFPSVINLWFSVLLIMALKNYHYARHILRSNPSEVFVFQGALDDQYPLLSGNAALNFILNEQASQKNIPVTAIQLDQRKDPLLSEAWSLKREIRSAVKKCIEWFYGKFARPPRDCDVLAFGSLRHLESTMTELSKRGKKVAFYDDEIRVDHLRFSKRNKISYVLSSCVPAAKTGFAGRGVAEMTAALDHPDSAVHFTYDGYDFRNYIRGRIFGTMPAYMKRLLDEEAVYAGILGRVRVKGALLDEDFNAHSFFAEFMKKENIPVFCISHANLALDGAVNPSSRYFEQSYTFVQGEHEKETFLERGWTEDKIVLTGIPRYDRSTELCKQRANFWKPENNLRILHCTGFLWPASPDIPGYIGVDSYAYRYYQETAVRAFVEASRGLPVTFVLKPHYAEDESAWRDFLKKEFPHDAVEVAGATRNYFELLMESDAMAVHLWTSTIIESGIANLPVLYYDIDETNSAQIQKLEASGLCRIFKDIPSLRKYLEELCARRRMPEDRFELNAAQARYLGRLDARATQRVCDFIESKIGGSHV